MISFFSDSRSDFPLVLAKNYSITILNKPETKANFVPTLFWMVLAFCRINYPRPWKFRADLSQLAFLSKGPINGHRMRIVENHD